MNLIDSLLNKITMYLLVLYFLRVLYFGAIILSFFKILPYNPFDFLVSGLYVTGACWVINHIFARVYKIKPNNESSAITGLILALIIGPLSITVPNFIFLTLAALLAMGSKYIVAVNKQHIFNPAAFAVTITAIVLHQGSSWWVGDKIMLPLIIIGGLLVLRKTNRFHLVTAFLASSTLFLLLFGKIKAPDILSYILNPATLFFAFVMLTEPNTSPPNKKLRIYFGAFTGFIMVALQHFFVISYTMELALLIANALGRIAHFSTKHYLTLKEKKELAPGIWEFFFTPSKQINFLAGQYLEWTVPHAQTDTRGNRRYFTISSSPTEKEIGVTVKIPEKPSSFKKALLDLKEGQALYATNLEGEFVLEKDPKIKYAFIAGGIGITPFRSIVQYMLDKELSYPITLFYIVHSDKEIVFDDLFEKAKKTFDLKIVHVVSENPPQNWHGEVGRLNEEMVKKHIPDYDSRTFYISGPQPMIVSYKEMLRKMGVKKIKTDYFPGY